MHRAKEEGQGSKSQHSSDPLGAGCQQPRRLWALGLSGDYGSVGCAIRDPRSAGTWRRPRPFDIHNHKEILHEWLRWFATKRGKYGRADFGFNYDTLKGILPRNPGGTRAGGGGGGDEFK